MNEVSLVSQIDPEWRNSGGVVRGLPRMLHRGGAVGVDQTDGGSVLACDRSVH